MDSPKASPPESPPKSPPGEDSPFSQFVKTLSPLQIKSTSYPLFSVEILSPGPVFASPVDRPRRILPGSHQHLYPSTSRTPTRVLCLPGSALTDSTEISNQVAFEESSSNSSFSVGKLLIDPSESNENCLGFPGGNDSNEIAGGGAKVTAPGDGKQPEELSCGLENKRKNRTDDSKSCSCRKSKCLKLYCECFANGSFCKDECACRDCSNKPEQEQIVRKARQQIELRNPQAFEPKVVLRTIQPTENSMEATAPSMRHRRGCNCKKSHCLKKYCECFDAGAGCFYGCRCENCQNKFGRMEGPGNKENRVLRDMNIG